MNDEGLLGHWIPACAGMTKADAAAGRSDIPDGGNRGGYRGDKAEKDAGLRTGQILISAFQIPDLRPKVWVIAQ